MRTFLLIIVFLTFAIKLPAEDTNAPAPPETNAPVLLKIGTGEADKHYGQEMIVTGTVAQVSIRSRMIFLNLDQPYPDSPFTVVIFPGKYLADVEALEGKAVEIKGEIKNYHDKPEIVLDNTDQLTVLGSIQSTNAPIMPLSTNAPAIPQPTNAPPPSTVSTNFPEIM
jgi:DNA/RNA endonuclease YhcR with UshA esterase domain